MRGPDLGVAVIGCGYWGINYVRVINELPGVRVVMVCDPDPQRLELVSQRFSGTHLASKLSEVLGSKEVQAAVVCTVATTHYDVAFRCLQAQKHVLVEKPMSTSTEECGKLIESAQRRGLILMVAHTFLYNSAIRAIKRYVDQGELGKVYYLYARRTNLGPFRRDVNAIWDLAPHDVSIFNYLLETQPIWVSGIGSKVLRNGREDVGFVTLGYPRGIVGNIHVSWVDPKKVRELVVVGSEKRAAFDDLNSLERLKIFEKGVTASPSEAATFGEHNFLVRDGNILSPRVAASEPLKNQCEEFRNCVVAKKPPLTDGFSGQEIVRVMTAIDQSVRLNGTPVSIETQGRVAAGS